MVQKVEVGLRVCMWDYVVSNWHFMCRFEPLFCIPHYSQTSLIRASLICMPYNPNTFPGNIYLFSIYNDSVIRMFHNPNTF